MRGGNIYRLVIVVLLAAFLGGGPSVRDGLLMIVIALLYIAAELADGRR